MTGPSSVPVGGADRIAIVDALRGIAALAVTWFHLTDTFPTFPVPYLKASGRHGHLGVQIFFVISGFVMPWALHRARYSPHDYGRFIAKRLIRIDIPCFVALGIGVILCAIFGPLYRWDTELDKITGLQLVLHLGYLNRIFAINFLNGVLWSLAVELQYYLLLGLLFPLLVAPKPWIRIFPFGLLTLLGFIEGAPVYMFRFAFLFSLGFAVFQLRLGLIGRTAFLLLVPILTTGAWMFQSAPEAVVGAVAALSIAFLGRYGKPLRGLGSISFSLYLLHVPIGVRLVAWGAPYATSPAPALALLLAAMAASLGAAWLLWRLVEQPAQRWAARLAYRAVDR